MDSPIQSNPLRNVKEAFQMCLYRDHFAIYRYKIKMRVLLHFFHVKQFAKTKQERTYTLTDHKQLWIILFIFNISPDKTFLNMVVVAISS